MEPVWHIVQTNVQYYGFWKLWHHNIFFCPTDIKKKKSAVCQFSSPLPETSTRLVVTLKSCLYVSEKGLGIDEIGERLHCFNSRKVLFFLFSHIFFSIHTVYLIEKGIYSQNKRARQQFWRSILVHFRETLQVMEQAQRPWLHWCFWFRGDLISLCKFVCDFVFNLLVIFCDWLLESPCKINSLFKTCD